MQQFTSRLAHTLETENKKGGYYVQMTMIESYERAAKNSFPGQLENNYAIYPDIPDGINTGQISLTRSGVNDRSRIREFLLSDMKWAEVDLHHSPANDDLIVRDEPFEMKPLHVNESLLGIGECMEILNASRKGIKINIRKNMDLNVLVRRIKHYNSDRAGLWLSSGMEYLTGQNYIELAQNFPGILIECKVDFLLPVVDSPERVSSIIKLLSSWGINSFALKWVNSDERKLLAGYIRDTGFSVNFYDVHDIESLIDAITIRPSSVSCSFDAAGYDLFDISAVA